ncbi:hypothetical protein NECAME_03135 [Necator americanus]|uniref:Uncharacterized protein n=1 Tax=Necator americanus TaxID=51031 RepID=W2T763_NECAM|nr:hypothetical protein NECAME_03135 [Necator americanus]ETN77474.1 hypothetical protein NECAME_03135 [Necator americanus]
MNQSKFMNHWFCCPTAAFMLPDFYEEFSFTTLSLEFRYSVKVCSIKVRIPPADKCWEMT